MHGQRKSQLQASMYRPLTAHCAMEPSSRRPSPPCRTRSRHTRRRAFCHRGSASLRGCAGGAPRVFYVANGGQPMGAQGGCYCGAVRYQAEGDALFKGQCHCRECQYISGGHPNVVMGMAEPGFTYTKGTGKQFRRSDLERPATREFCAECGTHMITRTSGLPGAVLIKVGTL